MILCGEFHDCSVCNSRDLQETKRRFHTDGNLSSIKNNLHMHNMYINPCNEFHDSSACNSRDLYETNRQTDASKTELCH